MPNTRKRHTNFNHDFFPDDKILIGSILNGQNELAVHFLKNRCAAIFEYIRTTRLKEIDIETGDLINDFYIYLQENNWEKLRAFRFESKLQTWINVVASRYFLKKYHRGY